MVKEGRPRRGSLQFVPRKRARRLIPRIRTWPPYKGVLGFIGYKVGMLTALVKVEDKNHPFYGQEIAIAATAVEVPPIFPKEIRVYQRTPYGFRIVTQSSDPRKLKEIEPDRISLLFETNPKAAGLPKKHPEVVEIGFGGSLDEAIEVLEKFQETGLPVTEFLKDHRFIDVIAVTKGKGLAGVVKRYGVALLSHKAEKSRRKVGTLGPWTPKRVRWTVPMPGQLGFHVRTEYNKEILYAGEGKEFNPASGWHRYGIIRSDVVIVRGSIPGPVKRPIRLRLPVRPGKAKPLGKLTGVVFYGREVKRLGS